MLNLLYSFVHNGIEEIDNRIIRLFERQRKIVANKNFHFEGWDVTKFYALLKAFVIEFDLVGPVNKNLVSDKERKK